jgi:hypothetical protein
MAAKEKKALNTVTVKVVAQAINENGAHYTQGENLIVTPVRAAALGSLVSIVDTPDTAEADVQP